MEELSEEQPIINRLARVHKTWRNNRPITPRPSQAEKAALIRETIEKVQNPEPADIVAIREVQNDPIGTEIKSQLSIVGWRLYAKGGADLLLSTYSRIERDEHPGFVTALSIAWHDIGAPNDSDDNWKRRLQR